MYIGESMKIVEYDTFKRIDVFYKQYVNLIAVSAKLIATIYHDWILNFKY